ncbi:MAG: VanZ like family protein [Microgenomates group bacterium ADurb.Bin219]|nr:MAG: VanZ like family protein [Microgenomates group bacterium ADurb.Bin219]
MLSLLNRKAINRFFYYWLPVFFWMGLIFWLSSFHKLEVSQISWQDFIFRKAAHFSEYTLLFLLYYRAFKNSLIKTDKYKLVYLSLFLAILYSMSDEYHQTFVSGRSGRLFDVTVDSLGSLFGAFLVTEISPLLPGRWRKLFEKLKII